METEFYADVAKSFADSTPVGTAGDGAGMTAGGITKGTGSMSRAKSFGESMYESHPDSMRRNNIQKTLNSFLLDKMKLGTTDIGALLVTSISPRMAFIRNEETPLLNLFESAPGPELLVDDWQYRVVERRQGTVRASQVNPEASPLTTTTLQSVRTEKFNTLGFWGDPISVSFVATAQAEQQQGVNLLRQEMDSQVLRIRKRMNYDYWNSVRQQSFAPQNTPAIGGLISRITTNTDSIGGIDLTALLLEGYNALVGAQVGFNVQKMLFGDPRQMGAVRTIEIARYGGSNQTSYLEWNRVMKEQFSQYRVPVDRVYEFNIGPAMPVAHDTDLPSGVAVILTINPDYIPRPVNFQIGGQVGPWMFVRPVYDLKETVFVLNGGTLDDPAEETRVLIQNTL